MFQCRDFTNQIYCPAKLVFKVEHVCLFTQRLIVYKAYYYPVYNMIHKIHYT